LGELAVFNKGFCVITTRTLVADIADQERTSALRRDLEQLSSDAGAKLLRALGVRGDETQIEASFRAAIRIAKEQKSVSLEKRAEATYAEYCLQKTSGSGERGFRLPLW
jgi:hypothetical protein